MRRLSDIILNQNPLILQDTDRVADACRQMADAHVGSVLVVDEHVHLCGIFTGRDVVHRVIASGRDATATLLADVMTPNPVVMPTQRQAIEALRLMWDGGFRHVPVVDEGRILGVVSRGDFRGTEEQRLEEERELWEHMR